MCSSDLILLSNYRLHVGGAEEAEAGLVNLALSCIESVEAKDLFYVHVHCKDARYYRISFGDNAACEEWYQRLSAALNPPVSLEEAFALLHYQSAQEALFEELEEEAANWDGGHETFRHEVTRLAFDLTTAWRISSINREFNFCPTYPADILVPACISDMTLEKVASFRSAKRVPAVVWRHVYTGNRDLPSGV